MSKRMSRRMLREEITRVILFESQVEKLEDDVDDVEKAINSELESMLGNLEKIADKQETKKVDEAGGALIAGAALAMPVIMKGIGKLAGLLQRSIGKVKDGEDSEWEAWWAKKSDDLHHLYIGACEKIVDAAVKIAMVASKGKYKDPGAEAKKRAANILFMGIIAILAVSAGVGVANALAHKSYAVAGTESILGSIKVAEIQAMVGELLVETLGLGGAASIAPLAADAAALASQLGPT